MAGSAAFQKAVGKRPGAKAAMQAAKDAPKGGDRTPPVIPDGVYLLRIKSTCGVTNGKEVPFVEFRWTIQEGDYKGKGWNKTYYFGDDDTPEQEERTFTNIGRDFKTLLQTDILKAETIADFATLSEEVDRRAPFVRGRIKTTKKGDRTYINAFLNEVVEVKVDGEVGGSNTNGADSVSNGGDSTSDGTGTVEVTPRSQVIYEGEEWEVVTSNPARKTCTLKQSDGRRENNVAWMAVEVLG